MATYGVKGLALLNYCNLSHWIDPSCRFIFRSVTVKQGLVQQGFVSVGFFANLFLSLFVFFCLFLAFVIWVVTFSLLMSWGAPAPNTKDQSCSMLGWISLRIVRIRHCPLLLCLVLRGIGCCCCRCCCCCCCCCTGASHLSGRCLQFTFVVFQLLMLIDACVYSSCSWSNFTCQISNVTHGKRLLKSSVLTSDRDSACLMWFIALRPKVWTQSDSFCDHATSFFSMDGMDSGGIGCSGLRWDGSRNLTKEGG